MVFYLVPSWFEASQVMYPARNQNGSQGGTTHTASVQSHEPYPHFISIESRERDLSVDTIQRPPYRRGTREPTN